MKKMKNVTLSGVKDARMLLLKASNIVYKKGMTLKTYIKN